MIDNQKAAIFKSKQDFNKNKEKILQYIVRCNLAVHCSVTPFHNTAAHA